VPYNEERVLPFFHYPAAWRWHRGRGGTPDRASSKYSTPVLRCPDGRLLCDSRAIVAYVSDAFAPPGQGLDPGPEAGELATRLHDKLGPHTRRVAYSAVFERPALLRRMANENVEGWQPRVFSPLVPVAGIAMRRMMNITDEAATRSVGIIQREFDLVADRLADGRSYLMGDRFTSVDLDFACMAAPAVLPPEYSTWLPTIDDVSDRIAAPMRQLADHPAGQFALRMFAEERNRVVGPRSVPGP
jgi:glutathione S-transferase